ncbi:MAG: acetyl-CoA carboxylase biotin carboxyl carrier protein [Gemmatimonadota bacterium]
MDLDWIRRLIDMVDDSEIDSLEISRWGTRVRVSKSPSVHVVSGGGAAMPAQAAAAPVAGAAPAAATAADGAPPASASADTVDVESPMVGTFYRAPAPDAPSYVEVGDKVQKGQTLCILEAMKLMNELEAEIAGTIREICVGNGDPVEYGQALFRIEAD